MSTPGGERFAEQSLGVAAAWQVGVERVHRQLESQLAEQDTPPGKFMSEPKKPPSSNSSRTFVIAVVAVLIVVAIAGIVLAGRRAPADPAAAAAASTTSPAAPAVSGSTLQAASSPTGGVPKELVFDPASDKLPPHAGDDLVRFAEAARASASAVRLSARFLTGANKAHDLELAKARTGAIRQALEADGISSGKMQVELIEMPEGSLTAAASNRIDLTLR